MENSSLTIEGDGWDARLPLEMSFEKLPLPSVTYKGDDIQLETDGGMTVAVASANTGLALENGKWSGKWRLEGVNVRGMSAVPLMDGSGTVSVNSGTIDIKGSFTNGDKSIRASLSLHQDMNASSKSVLTIESARMPWMGGTVSAGPIRIPLAGRGAIPLTVRVAGVSIDMLMQSLTGKRVTATGTVSGTIPLSISRDGEFTLADGGLQAEGPGRIALPPDIIPGNNGQIVMVRDLLKDLHYTNLRIQVGGNGEKGLAVKMVVEGSNPDAYQGPSR